MSLLIAAGEVITLWAIFAAVWRGRHQPAHHAWGNAVIAGGGRHNTQERNARLPSSARERFTALLDRGCPLGLELIDTRRTPNLRPS